MRDEIVSDRLGVDYHAVPHLQFLDAGSDATFHEGRVRGDFNHLQLIVLRLHRDFCIRDFCHCSEDVFIGAVRKYGKRKRDE